MNKTAMIEQIAKDASITKSQANEALDAFTNAIVSTLKKGDKVALVGFGTFSVVQRGARTGRNPQTGEILKIKARKAPRFKAGSGFSNAVSSAKAAKK